MMPRFHHALLLLLLAFAPAVPAQEPTPEADNPTIDDLFGGEDSAVVEEEVADYGPGPAAYTISAEEQYRRTLLYSAASRYMLQVTLETLLADEAARREAAGLYVGDIEISEEELDADMQKHMDAVLAQDPAADFWAQVIAQGFTKETYRRELKRNMQAQRMFFPLDPELWPVEQLKVILGRNWTDYLQKDHETLLKKKADTGEFQELNDQILNQFLMPNVWNWLMRQETILYPSDGLPEGVALRIGDHDLMTEDLLAAVDPILGDTMRQQAREFMDNVALLRSHLEAQGAWMDYDAFRREFAAEEKMYEGTIIPHSMMVLDFLGFPSMEIYRQYFWAKKSFARTLPPKQREDGSENPDYRKLIDAQIAERGDFYRGGKVKVDVILLSARDKRTGQYPLKGDPYLAAKERADEVQDILLSGEDYLETLLEYSDYPEKTGTGNATMPQPNRGRLPMQSRNDMRGFLGESDYTDFLFGYSMADDIFFHAEAQAIYGPVKNPLGWSFYRLESRNTPQKVLKYGEDERDTFIVEDDLVTTRFLAYLDALRAE